MDVSELGHSICVLDVPKKPEQTPQVLIDKAKGVSNFSHNCMLVCIKPLSKMDLKPQTSFGSMLLSVLKIRAQTDSYKGHGHRGNQQVQS